MQKYKESLIIGIVGGSASGKSTLAKALFDVFRPFSTLVTQDHYYKPKHLLSKDANGETNFDLPNAVDLNQLKLDVLQLLEGKNVVKQKYNFNNPNLPAEEEIWEPKPIIFIEGMFAFEKELLNLYDFKIYVSSPKEIKLKRRLIRDEKERGYEINYINYQWKNHVVPAHQEFVLQHKGIADIIFINDKSDFQFNGIKKFINYHLNHSGHSL